MALPIFLALETLVWLPYGLYCLFAPAYLAQAAGVAFLTPTGSTELRAMYGGLQTALGALTLSATLRAERRRAALVTLAFLCGGLGTARLLGVMLDGSLSGYTIAGLLFEFLSAGFALRFLRAA